MTDRHLASGICAATGLSAALFFSGGCGASLSANKRSPGKLENGVFKPSLPPEANYGPDPALTCPERGINGLVNEEVAAVAKPDGRLCALADTLLGWEGDTVPDGVLQSLSHYFGLPQPVRRVLLSTFETEEMTSKGPTPGAPPKDVASRLAETIKNQAATAQALRYGLQVQRVKLGTTRAVLVLQDQSLELQPVPRRLEPGQTAALSGQVLGKLTNPKVHISDATGKLIAPPATPGKAFQAQVSCGDKPGRIVVQVSAEQEGGETQVAAFPIGCATDLAAAATVASKPAGPVDPAQAEQRMAELINNDRTAAGVKPLQVDKKLSDVARSVSQDRAQSKGTSSAELSQRLKDAEIASPSIFESAQQALTPEDAYQSISENPGERANAMNPDLTLLGIGVVAGPVISGKPTLIATELYAKLLPPPDPAALAAKLYQGIAKQRAGAGASEVKKDPVLEQIAQKYAEAMAANKGQIPKAEESALVAPLYKGYRTVNIMGGATQDGSEFLQSSGVTGKASLVGIGTAVGTSPQYGKNTLFVVILLGAKADGAAAKPGKTKKK